MKALFGLFALSLGLLLGCGKKAPEQQANVPDANPPAQPPAKEPKVEPIKAKLTPGMFAANKAREARQLSGSGAVVHRGTGRRRSQSRAQLGAIILPAQ